MGSWEALKEMLRSAGHAFARLFPPAASAHAEGVDTFYVFLVGVSAFFALLIAGLIVWFTLVYYRGRSADRANPPWSNVPLEIVWTGIPIMISAAIFIWGARLYMGLFAAPGTAGGETIFVVGKQWMWKAQHPQGPREINSLHVPVGAPIRLLLTSQDVVHSFFLPALRIKRDAVPGRYTSLWFQATRTGEFPIYCTEFCGADHSGMRGKLVIMRPSDYADWLGRGTAEESPARAGEALFSRMGCAGCHATENAATRAPSLSGLYGKPVPLQGGGFATADEAYIRESVFFPARKVVAGYEPLMPTFAGQLSEEQVMELIAYIRSLGTP
jgi:cytochrome c oxidase subunit 2